MTTEKISKLGELILKSHRNCVPLNLFIELTHHCNLNCIHCCVSKKDSKLPTEKIKSILDEAQQMGTLFLTLTGGEPMTHSDFFDIANHARSLNYAIRIFTNATLIDENAADMLSELCPMEVDISIYSHDPETNDKITGINGSFNAVLCAVELLKERKINTSLKCVLMKQNFDHYEELFKLAEQLSLPCRIDPTITTRDNGNAEPLDFRINHTQLRKILGDTRIFPHLNPAPNPDNWCHVGTTELAITPEGDVIPCIQWRIPAGNVNEQNLKTIWETSPVFLSLRNISNSQILPCQECNALQWCARCPGIANVETGQWDKPYEWACTTAKLLKELKTS
ncbi:MAG: radical SAM protein [bacterium]